MSPTATGKQGLTIALAVIAVGTLFVGAAKGVETAGVSVGFYADGTGSMIANSQTNPDTETWSWMACGADLSACNPFSAGRITSTQGASPLTVFRAISSLGASANSPVWRGTLSSRKPPSARGPLYANELITPVAAKWQGGWAGAGDWTQLAACRGPRGHGCITLTDLHFPQSCRHEAVVIDPIFTGWYLRVASQRVGPHPMIFDFAVGSPYGQVLWKRSPTVSVNVLGRIAGPGGPRVDACGAPPITEDNAAELGI